MFEIYKTVIFPKDVKLAKVNTELQSDLRKACQVSRQIRLFHRQTDISVVLQTVQINILQILTSNCLAATLSNLKASDTLATLATTCSNRCMSSIRTYITLHYIRWALWQICLCEESKWKQNGILRNELQKYEYSDRAVNHLQMHWDPHTASLYSISHSDSIKRWCKPYCFFHRCQISTVNSKCVQWECEVVRTSRSFRW